MDEALQKAFGQREAVEKRVRELEKFAERRLDDLDSLLQVPLTFANSSAELFSILLHVWVTSIIWVALSTSFVCQLLLSFACWHKPKWLLAALLRRASLTKSKRHSLGCARMVAL